MNRQGQIPRSRGGICGVLLILLGLWGGLAPFVGPYFHFGFTPDKVWDYNSARLYYSIIPGGAALLGGVLVTVTRNRAVGILGGVLGVLGGAWFVVGTGFVAFVLKKTIFAGTGIMPPVGGSILRLYLEGLALFSGLGLLILLAGGIAVGRFSLLAASDVGAYDGYYADVPQVPPFQPAAQPDLGSFPTAAGHFPDPDPMTQTVGRPAVDPFAPAPRPDITTAPFPPDSTT
jgi:hypothetical protein